MHKIGDRIRLASGRVVAITVANDPARPWQAVETNGYWVLRRPDETEHFSYYFGGEKRPMELSKSEAGELLVAVSAAR